MTWPTGPSAQQQGLSETKRRPENHERMPINSGMQLSGTISTLTPTLRYSFEEGRDSVNNVLCRAQPECTTPVTFDRPLGLSASLLRFWAPAQQIDNSVIAHWHPGSTADLFNKWIGQPLLPGVEEEREANLAFHDEPGISKKS